MSIRMMSQVWERSQAQGMTLLLLLKLADFANDEGWCWPSQEVLATAIRRKRRQVQNIIAELVAMKELQLHFGSGPRHTNRYRITVPDAKPSTFHAEPEGAKNCTGAKDCAVQKSARSGDESATDCAHEKTASAQFSANECAIRLRTNHQEPSLEESERKTSARVNVNEVDKVKKLKRLAYILERLLVPGGAKAMRQWMALAKDHGRTDIFEDAIDCIWWSVNAARDEGLKVQYPEEVIAHAKRWANRPRVVGAS